MKAKRCDVLFYLPWAGPLFASDDRAVPGGSETQVWLLSRALARQGLRTCVSVWRSGGRISSPTASGVHIDVLPRPWTRIRFVGKFAEFASLFRALVRVRSRVVVTRAAGTHVFGVGVVCRLLRRRFVYSSANTSDFELTLFPNARDRRLFVAGLRLAQEIVVQTEEQAELCRTCFGIEPVVIRSVVETHPAEPVQRDAFLWIGRSAWYKRPHDFINLARAVPEASFQMVLVPHEDGSELYNALRAAARSVPNLRLLDARPRRELIPLIRSAIAVVSTSEFEGMPNVLLEAWSLGVPTIVRAHDPDGVIAANDLGVVCDARDDILIAATRKLWNRRDELGETADRLRAYVARTHGEERIAAAWTQVIERETGVADVTAIRGDANVAEV